MKKLYDGVQRFCAAHPRFGIPNLMRVIVIGNVAVYVLMLLTQANDANALSFLTFNLNALLHGEVWRLVTFVFVPAYSSPFALLISLYFYYWIGSTLERQWGTAKFNLYYISGALLTVLVVVLLTNAYNLIDGIDGLCSGLALLALGAFGGWFCWNHLYVYGMMAMGIAGVVSVFFFYNVLGRRMKIFMGDTGSLTLGFLIAFFGLKFYNLNINTDMFGIQATPAVFLGIVFIPAFDTLRVFCVRIASGLSPFYPDKRHIHHKMLRLGLTHFQSAMLIIVMQTCFILMNVLMKNVNINLLFGIDLLLGVLLVWQLDRMGDRRERKGKA